MRYWLDRSSCVSRCLRIHFDGSFDQLSGKGAAAWLLETSSDSAHWTTIAWQVVRVFGSKSSTATELTAGVNALAYLREVLLHGPGRTEEYLANQQPDKYE
eukprot:12359850-Karenia_brevis.AAC.1